MTKHLLIVCAVCAGFALSACERQSAQQAAASAQPASEAAPSTNAAPYPPKEWPTSYWPAKDWQWPELEPVKAAPRNHKILWQNDHVR